MKPCHPITHTVTPSCCPGLLRAITGPLIWACSFLALYVAHAQGCQLIVPAALGWLTVGLIALWVFPATILCIMLLASWRRLRPAHKPRSPGVEPVSTFMPMLILLLDLSSLVAVLATGLPILFIPACAAPV